jgi:hypothetical protein
MSNLPQQLLPETWGNFVGSLSQIWNELGMEDGVRSTHLNDVLRQINDVLNERVRQERNVRDLTRRSIQTFASKIVLIYKQLDRDETMAHEFISDNTGPQVALFQSRDTLSRHLDELVAVRPQRTLWLFSLFFALILVLLTSICFYLMHYLILHPLGA